MVSVARIKHHNQKKLGVEKGLFDLYVQITVHYETKSGTQGRNWRQEAKTIKEYLLACSPWFA